MKTFTLIGPPAKLIKLNNAEVQILEHLQEGAELTEQQALHQVISYKREQILVHEQAGNYDLVEMLLKEVDDWTEIHARRLDMLRLEKDKEPPVKIYIP